MTGWPQTESVAATFTMTMPERLMRFLLVEDDEDHAHLVVHHLRRSNPRNQVEHVWDGFEALQYLRREGMYADAARPDLVLLDLKLPKVDGHQVLAHLKSDPHLKTIPVVILTTSDNEADRERAYNCYANSYLVKPLDFKEFKNLVEVLSRYWRDWNHPQRGHHDP